MLIDLLKKNRSYRGYDDSFRIDRSMLEELIDCTRYTASSVNIQPLKYFAASEPETVALIQPLTHWAGKLKELHLPREGHRPTAFIVICQDMSVSDSPTMFQRDIGIAAQTILLAATEKGLGGCMIGSFEKNTLKKALSLPEQIEPMMVLAIGKPDETVLLTEVGPGGSTDYYRDENDVHFVPKRALKDILL
ncbi:MAG: nitroreductase family protein [Candidatus Fimivicinus sp.]|nr:nitroreductase family protein [Oscillospiraceae bacterium]MDY5590822.1 nitroreductase family protein [Candidatus Fimivicinus sp.]